MCSCSQCGPHQHHGTGEDSCSMRVPFVCIKQWFWKPGILWFSMQSFWTKAAAWLITLDELPMKFIRVYGSTLLRKWCNLNKAPKQPACKLLKLNRISREFQERNHGSWQLPNAPEVHGCWSISHTQCVIWSPPAFVIIARLPSFLMKKWKLKGISNFLKITAEVY